MKAYYDRFGWTEVDVLTWVRWLLFCSWAGHIWKDLGDLCYCGSDNCDKCIGCGFEDHD